MNDRLLRFEAGKRLAPRKNCTMDIDHECCEDHESVMRGVCYCPSASIVFINPRLFSQGGICIEATCEEDLEAFDLAEFALSHWFPALEDKWSEMTLNSVQMPGMVAECYQVPGKEGHEILSRMP